jgi:probable F420-dependent oxidoreductase
MVVESYGVILRSGLSAEDLRGFCRLADEHDMGVWVNDGGRGVDAFALLGAAAALTDRATLGTAVLLLPLRHPVLIARSALTIDSMSGGRLVLGVGVGGERQPDFESASIRKCERGARTDEAIGVVRALWSGEKISHHGRYYPFSDVQLQVQPGQSWLPIWIGGRMGGGGKYRDAALKRAARCGDAWFPYQMSPQQLAAGIERLRGYCAEAGRSTVPETALVVFINIDDDDARSRETAIRVQSHVYGVDFSQLVDRVVITGTPQMCAERIAAYQAAGAAHLIFNWSCDPADVPRLQRRLVEDVLPRVESSRRIQAAHSQKRYNPAPSGS